MTEFEITQDSVEEDKASPTVEELASEIGWRPDGELDAKAYILKSRDIQDTMRDHIKTQKKQLTELGSSVEELKVHNERVYKAEVARLETEIKTLKSQRKDAIEEGDVEKVDALDEQIDGLKEAMVKPKTPATSSSNSDFDAWIEANPWYYADKEMAAYADSIAEQNPGAPFKRVSDLVNRKVKEMFPEKFTSEPGDKRPAPSPVEGAGKRIATSKFTESDLTESQRSIMSQFVRQGIMTKKQYIDDIAKTQGA